MEGLEVSLSIGGQATRWACQCSYGERLTREPLSTPTAVADWGLGDRIALRRKKPKRTPLPVRRLPMKK